MAARRLPALAGSTAIAERISMNVTRVAVTLGLAWLAANLLLKSRVALPRQSESDDGLAPFPSVDPGLPVGLGAVTAGAPAAADAAGATGSDSPNDAERLQASGLATAAGDAGDQFKSTSQESPYARAPGLPDFARGA
jgi:hypothetical protein